MEDKSDQYSAAGEVHAYAGTAGHSAWFSDDLGSTWIHPNSHSGMYLEARVWALSSHPAVPDSVYAGTDQGLFRWNEHSARWVNLSLAQDVWSVVQDPRDPAIIYAGARPAALYRSTDGGRVWSELAVPGIAKLSEVNMGPTRVTQILFDPFVADRLWATIEIGGIYRSDDRGLTWTRLRGATYLRDVAVDPVNPWVSFAAGSRGYHSGVQAAGSEGLLQSLDNGQTWGSLNDGLA